MNEQDNILASAVMECADILNKKYQLGTLDSVTACFNLTIKYIRICTVCNEKKDVEQIAEKMFSEYLKEISSRYE